jgi:hypothetical protein
VAQYSSDYFRRHRFAGTVVDGQSAVVKQDDPVGEPHGEVEIVKNRDR